jgi:hypothetical protein
MQRVGNRSSADCAIKTIKSSHREQPPLLADHNISNPCIVARAYLQRNHDPGGRRVSEIFLPSSRLGGYVKHRACG